MQVSKSEKVLLKTVLTDAILSTGRGKSLNRVGKDIFIQRSIRLVKTRARMSFPRAASENKEIASPNLRSKKMVPGSHPPTTADINQLYRFFDKSSKLVVLSGAGMSTECGIPDYRSPNGAYSTGFRPITHQEFLRSVRARRRYWARSYAGWKRFTASQPGPAHVALATLESMGRIHFMITQNVDRLHHRAGSNPLELHGTVYTVVCIDCGFSLSRSLFQDQVKAFNPKWAEAIENLDYDSRSDKSFGMKIRPDGDIEIDEKFWEEEFHIPSCHKCSGILKPDVVFFGDNLPKARADAAMEAAKTCDAFLVLGSSLMTMSAFRLIRHGFVKIKIRLQACVCLVRDYLKHSRKSFWTGNTPTQLIVLMATYHIYKSGVSEVK